MATCQKCGASIGWRFGLCNRCYGPSANDADLSDAGPPAAATQQVEALSPVADTTVQSPVFPPDTESEGRTHAPTVQPDVPRTEPTADAPGELSEIRCPYCSEKILSTAKKCRHCGEWLIASTPIGAGNIQSSATNTPNAKPTNGLISLGVLLLVGGLVGTIYGFTMSAAIDSPLGKLNNIGLLNDKQNVIIISGVAALIGTILLVVPRSRGSR